MDKKEIARVVNLEVSDFEHELHHPGIVLLDVRTQEEYSEGHIRGSVNIDVESPDFLERVQGLYHEKCIIGVYCRSGRRSLEAANQLSRQGYSVYNLSGGILSWLSEDRETTCDQ